MEISEVVKKLKSVMSFVAEMLRAQAVQKWTEVLQTNPG